MKHRVAVAILIVLALATTAAVAGAKLHVKHFPTTFHVEYSAEPGGGGMFSGELISVKQTCNAARRIVVTTVGPEGREVIGKGSSNAQGRFEFAATGRPREDVTAEAEEKRIPPISRYVKRICLAGKAGVLVD